MSRSDSNQEDSRPSALELRLDEATPDRPVQLAAYEVLRRVGAGGSGIVYEARHRRGHAVAIKILRSATPGRIARLKREFRAVADLVHPNLCTVYELAVDGDAAFIAMEFIDGVDFCSFVRQSPPLADLPTGAAVVPSHHPPEMAARLDERKLRQALRLLADAIHILHERGQLHRDLKPSNVLVDASGRVVVVDFGLLDDGSSAEEREVVGTPAFMAPEQARGELASEASDWYAFGVILYLCLTGELPNRRFEHVPATHPSTLNPSIAADLDTLCSRLLQQDSNARPTGSEVRDVLARISYLPPTSHRPEARRERAALFGRSAELATLRSTFDEVSRGGSVLQWIQGGSGMGKSTLLRHFLRELHQTEPRPIVLQGRCFANETVPYKAFDSVIESLAVVLRRSRATVQSELPPCSAELAAMFPALASTLAQEPGESVGSLDANEVRARGFRSLRAVLTALARLRPVVLAVDDLQWGDADSAHLLREIVDVPVPGLLVLGACREEEVERSPFLRELDRLFQSALPKRAPTLRLGPLSEEDACALAVACLGEDRDEIARAIARDAAGSPFFIEELSRDDAAVLGDRSSDHRSLDRILLARIKDLAPAPRRVLEIASIAERSLDVGTVIAACSFGAEAVPALRILDTRSLVRTSGLGDHDFIEIYHDRIREAVLAALPGAELVARHAALAVSLEQRGATPEVLATHFLAGELHDHASKYAMLAATRASNAMAFDRAASFYGMALAALGSKKEGRGTLLVLRAEALVNAGRCAEAGDLFLDAAGHAAPGEALDLRRRAAEQLLVAGRVVEGTNILRSVAQETGLSFPDTIAGALGSAVVSLVRVAVGGLRLRSTELGSPNESARLATAFTAVRGISAFDMTRGAFFAVETLRLALRAGDRVSAARSMSAVGSNLIYGGARPMVLWGTHVLQKARAMARETGDIGIVASVDVHVGIARLTLGKWSDSIEVLEPAVRALKEQCAGYQHERSYGEMTALFALEALGRWRDVAQRALVCLREGDATGNLYLRVQSSMYLAVHRLAVDAPEEAVPYLHNLSAWPSAELGYLFQHWLGLKAAAMHALYVGDSERAYRLLQDAWPKLRASGLFGIRMVRTITHHLRAAAALQTSTRLPQLREVALRDAQALSHDPLAFGQAASHALHAAGALLDGRSSLAESHLRAAARMYEREGMAAHRAIIARRLGALMEGTEGRGLVVAAEHELSALGVVRPERWARIYALA